MRLPGGGAVAPAMNAATGFVTCCFTNAAASSSRRAADFADHDDRLGLVIGLIHLEQIDERGADDRVARRGRRRSFGRGPSWSFATPLHR